MNDFYDQSLGYDDVVDNIKEALRKEQQKLYNSQYILFGFIILLYVGLFIYFMVESIDFILLAIVTVFSVFLFMIVRLIIKSYGKQRVLYQTLFRDAVRLFNQEQDYTFTYTYKPKLDKAFNRFMGLFSRSASTSAHYTIDATIDEYDILIHHVRLVTSTGKSTTLHFDGIYIIFPVKNVPIQQYRTDSRPHLKGVKMDRVENMEERVYIEKEHSEIELDRRLETLFHSIPNKFDVKKYYVASNNKEIHLAFWPKKQPKLPKTINYRNIQSTINQVHDILSFTVETMHYLDESNYE